ncbi:MAG: hypothetical protein ACOC2J_03220, partial [bacterium]
EEIKKTDKVFFITKDNKTIYIKAYGLVTENDLATEISTITQGVLKPEEVKELSKGNIQFLQPKLLESVKIELKKQGLSENEIEALMNTEWDKLEELSKTRLTEAIAIRSGLPLDITRSLLEGDWEKIKSYAQMEMIQRVVQRILSNDLIS